MKRQSLLTVAAACAAATLGGCGGGSRSGAVGPAAAVASMPAPATVAKQSLDTAQLLGQARQPSDAGAPYSVDDGALTLTGTSESAEPIGVAGP